MYGYTFDPADPNVDITANGSGRRQDCYDRICNGYVVGFAGLTRPLEVRQRSRPQDLVPDVWVEVQRELPTPIPRIAPADLPGAGLRTSRTTRSSGSIRRRAVGHGERHDSAGGISVSVQAIPQRLIVDAGDGNTITCEGAPPAFVQGMDPTTFQGCAHVYRDSSSMAANGETFPVTVTIEWAASWSASDGQGGSLGTRRTTSEVRQLPVAESQAIVIAAGD